MKYVVNVYGCKVPSKDPVVMGDAEALHNRLHHALKDKFPEDDFYFTLIDMDSEDNMTDYDENLIERMENGDFPPPLVTVNDEIAVHGDIDVETVVEWLELKKHGY